MKKSSAPKSPMMLGQHYIVEMYDCNVERLDDVAFIGKMMVDAADAAGATILHHYFHQFNPHGVSGAVIIAESHLTIHTWPEYGYAAVDLFTCGSHTKPMLAFEMLQEMLQSRTVSFSEIKRGKINPQTKVFDQKMPHLISPQQVMELKQA